MKKIQIARAAPVLNTPDFSFAFGGSTGREIPVNANGHPFCYEWVAMPGMEFKVSEEIDTKEGHRIYKILCPSYPIQSIYIDSRFTGENNRFPPPVLKRDEILNKMKERIGTPYVWGGNWHKGIPELLDYYPPNGPIDTLTRIRWTLSGVDCSGLFFEIMNGTVPRNTSQLLHFGSSVPIANLKREKIQSILKPLDMILYFGHVLFVLDKDRIIESKSPVGVITRDLRERLEEILEYRIGEDEWSDSMDPSRQFVVRRFTNDH